MLGTLDPLDKFKAIYAEHAQQLKERGRDTESDTRANILDRVVHEVLGWPRAAVKRELYANPGFLDYELTSGRPLVVIEAKKSGGTFCLPHRGSKGVRTLKISGALSSEHGVDEALRQAQRYCSDRGIRYALVTNGYSYILFRGITEAGPWRDQAAVVFDSPDDVIENFTAFWNLLSYSAVKDGLLDEKFRRGHAPSREAHRPISQMVDADATYGRNPLNHALRPYVDRFFGDIAAQDQSEVLSHCYVHSRPIQIIDEGLRIAIYDQVPRFASHAKQLQTSEKAPGGEVESFVRHSVYRKIGKGKTVVLMGGIGAGKSTFLKRFFRIVVPDLINASGPASLAYLDMLGAPEAPDALDKHLWDTLANSLRLAMPSLNQRLVLEEVFADRISALKQLFPAGDHLDVTIGEELRILTEDAKRFSEAVLKWSATKGKLPIVVIDNVDQLAVDAQVLLFTSSQRFASALGAMSILVVREESYAASLMQKQLTAYTISPYHLSSPRFRDLIGVRIDFAVNAAIEAGRGPADALFDRALYSEIAEFLQMLRRSVFQRNKNIVRFVECVAFGNMRLALSLFNSFITSGAVNIQKMVAIANEGSYTVPFHEFAKSVILGDYRYYKEARSPTLNVFSVNSMRNSSHFTTLRILRYLDDHFGASRDGDGFVPLRDLVTAMVDVFDNEDDVVRTIERCIAINRQLVELDTRQTTALTGAALCRVTSSGRYYLYFLVNAFAYLDLVWHDTPLSDRGVCDMLSRLVASADMIDRFKRVELFLDYLRREEEAELNGLGLSADGDAFWAPIMPRIIGMYDREKQVICRKLGIKVDENGQLIPSQRGGGG